MLEAHLAQGNLLKRLVEAVREFIGEANFECTPSGIQLQAMEENHVTLVNFLLRSEGFESYRCDRNMCIGINVASLNKVLKCAGNDDAATLKADDNGDILTLTFAAPSKDKSSEFDLKLISLNAQSLSIPDTVYDATVSMSSSEFQRICRDLSTLSETVSMSVSKDSIKFSAEGDIGNGSIYVKSGALAADASEAAEAQRTSIQILKPVSASLSLKHMLMYTKATPLSPVVKICLSDEFPALFEYEMNDIGYLRFFLAPKIDEE